MSKKQNRKLEVAKAIVKNLPPAQPEALQAPMPSSDPFAETKDFMAKNGLGAYDKAQDGTPVFNIHLFPLVNYIRSIEAKLVQYLTAPKR